MNGETAVVQFVTGRRIFRTTCVKPRVRSDWNSNRDEKTQEEEYLKGDAVVSADMAFKDDKTYKEQRPRMVEVEKG